VPELVPLPTLQTSDCQLENVGLSEHGASAGFTVSHDTALRSGKEPGPDCPSVHWVMAALQTVARRVAAFDHFEALSLTRTLTQTFPESALLSVAHVSVSFQCQDGEEAFRRLWSHTLQLHPELVTGTDRLALYFRKRGLTPQLHRLANGLKANAPDREETALALALLADAQGDNALALEIAGRALERNRRHSCSWLVKAWLHLGSGERKEVCIR
jgi:hypothetical protein